MKMLLALCQVIRTFSVKKREYKQQCQQLTEQNRYMPVQYNNPDYVADCYEKLNKMLGFEQGSTPKNSHSNQQLDLPDSLDAQHLALISLPYGYHLIDLMSQLYPGSDYHFVLVMERQVDLPFIDMLMRLPRVTIMGHQELLSQLKNKCFAQQKTLILSCPELHPKTITTGHKISIKEIDYCFSFFDTMICLKNQLPLYALDAQQHDSQLVQYNRCDGDDSRMVSAFIFGQLVKTLSHQPTAVYSWQYLACCTIANQNARHLKRVNRLECIVRLWSRQTPRHSADITAIMHQIKRAKAAIRIT
jgi:hypothetical protein